MRPGAVRRLYSAARRRSDPLLRDAVKGCGQEEVTTIEGLGTIDKPHPLQKAFIEEQAAQCGYCLNGMIMTAKELLVRDPHPSVETIRRELSRNLCRCGTHVEIVRAVQRAAE